MFANVRHNRCQRHAKCAHRLPLTAYQQLMSPVSLHRMPTSASTTSFLRGRDDRRHHSAHPFVEQRDTPGQAHDRSYVCLASAYEAFTAAPSCAQDINLPYRCLDGRGRCSARCPPRHIEGRLTLREYEAVAVGRVWGDEGRPGCECRRTFCGGQIGMSTA